MNNIPPSFNNSNKSNNQEINNKSRETPEAVQIKSTIARSSDILPNSQKKHESIIFKRKFFFDYGHIILKENLAIIALQDQEPSWIFAILRHLRVGMDYRIGIDKVCAYLNNPELVNILFDIALQTTDRDKMQQLNVAQVDLWYWSDALKGLSTNEHLLPDNINILLSRAKNTSKYNAIYANPNVPSDVLIDILNQYDCRTKQYSQLSKQVSAEELEEADDGNYLQQEIYELEKKVHEVLLNPSIPEKRLEQYINSSPDLHMSLATNPSLSIDFFDRLMKVVESTGPALDCLILILVRQVI
jgi:hypothetical protein